MAKMYAGVCGSKPQVDENVLDMHSLCISYTSTSIYTLSMINLSLPLRFRSTATFPGHTVTFLAAMLEIPSPQGKLIPNITASTAQYSCKALSIMVKMFCCCESTGCDFRGCQLQNSTASGELEEQSQKVSYTRNLPAYVPKTTRSR